MFVQADRDDLEAERAKQVDDRRVTGILDGDTVARAQPGTEGSLDAIECPPDHGEPTRVDSLRISRRAGTRANRGELPDRHRTASTWGSREGPEQRRSGPPFRRSRTPGGTAMGRRPVQREALLVPESRTVRSRTRSPSAELTVGGGHRRRAYPQLSSKPSIVGSASPGRTSSFRSARSMLVAISRAVPPVNRYCTTPFIVCTVTNRTEQAGKNKTEQIGQTE